MNIKDSASPFWRWAMHVTWLLAALGSLYMFSSTFDESELKALGAIITAVAASEAVRQLITRDGGKPK